MYISEVQKTADFWWGRAKTFVKSVDLQPGCAKTAEVYFRECSDAGLFKDTDEINEMSEKAGMKAMFRKIGCDRKNARNIPFCNRVYLDAATKFLVSEQQQFERQVLDYGRKYCAATEEGAELLDLWMLYWACKPRCDIQFELEDIKNACADDENLKLSQVGLSMYVTSEENDFTLLSICRAKIYEQNFWDCLFIKEKIGEISDYIKITQPDAGKKAKYSPVKAVTVEKVIVAEETVDIGNGLPIWLIE